MEPTNQIPNQPPTSCMKKPKNPQQQENELPNIEDKGLKDGVKFSADDTFTSETGDEEMPIINEEYAREIKAKATPAFFKRQQATKHLVVQSPTDHFFSPVTQRLLLKKKGEGVKPVDIDDED